jgi:hypothetical protein
MRQRLEAFDELLTRYIASKQVDEYGDAALCEQLQRAEPTINQILKCLGSQAVINVDGWTGDFTAKGEVKRSLGILEDRDEWAVRLTPSAPSLPADQFHPWVWDAARTFWESKHFRSAVHAAASSISDHLQNKLGRRDVTDAALVAEALSNNAPAPGAPRLRIPGDPKDPGVKSRQRGALLLGQGAYAAFRNAAAHGVSDLPEQEALEQLATFSAFARLIDQCHVIT